MERPKPILGCEECSPDGVAAADQAGHGAVVCVSCLSLVLGDRRIVHEAVDVVLDSADGPSGFIHHLHEDLEGCRTAEDIREIKHGAGRKGVLEDRMFGRKTSGG
jgi:hypothetical protein